MKISVFQQSKAMVELQHQIKSVQSNWGKEYRPFTALLATHCITHRLICFHTHQHGVVERKYRHVEIGLTLLHRASLPLNF